MRYFTPELYVELQMCESPATARETNTRWERAIHQYHADLTGLLSAADVPGDLRDLVALGSLHDAEVLELGVNGTRLVVVVKEENRTGTLLLTYNLVAEPTILREVFAPEHQSLPRTWLYDELERDDANFRHSILLSDGMELRLQFSRLSILEVNSLLDPVQSTQQRDSILSATT